MREHLYVYTSPTELWWESHRGSLSMQSRGLQAAEEKDWGKETDGWVVWGCGLALAPGLDPFQPEQICFPAL